jgi:hypothetical protein
VGETIHVWAWAPEPNDVLCTVCVWFATEGTSWVLTARKTEAVAQLERVIADLERSYPDAMVTYHKAPPLEVYHQVLIHAAQRDESVTRGPVCGSCAFQPLCTVGQGIEKAGPLAPRVVDCPAHISAE